MIELLFFKKGLKFMEKELIVFIHALAAVSGMGTAIFLQIHATLDLVHEVRTRDQKIYEVGHKVIMISLGILVLSGLGFLIYYAANAPEALNNEKIYGKSLMVVILIFNGVVLNSKVQETLKNQVGKGIFEGITLQQIRIYFYNGTLSISFWGLIFILGTFRTLNNIFGIEIYIATIVSILILSGGIAHILSVFELRRQDKQKQAFLHKETNKSDLA